MVLTNLVAGLVLREHFRGRRRCDVNAATRRLSLHIGNQPALHFKSSFSRHSPNELRLSQASADELKARGIESISSIPADFPLTSKQVIIRDATASGKPYIATDLGRLLQPFGPPACYLDFEAMMPPIPLYEGTRPYQTIPFQWSLHTIDGDGVLSHKEFLADGVNDPRRQFAETLIDALACSDDPIIVYSAYEQTRLKELAADFPDLSTALNALIARLADLLPIVRSAVYFPILMRQAAERGGGCVSRINALISTTLSKAVPNLHNLSATTFTKNVATNTRLTKSSCKKTFCRK